MLQVLHVTDLARLREMLDGFEMKYTGIFMISCGHTFISFKSASYAQSILTRFNHDVAIAFQRVLAEDVTEVLKFVPPESPRKPKSVTVDTTVARRMLARHLGDGSAGVGAAVGATAAGSRRQR